MSDCVVHGDYFSQGNQSKMQESAINSINKRKPKYKKGMNISPQECHNVRNILDTHVILDGEVKGEIVIQGVKTYIKNDYLPTNMTANVNV